VTKFAGAVWAALRGQRSTAPHSGEGITTMATQLFQPQRRVPHEPQYAGIVEMAPDQWIRGAG
jgi:hypothetical protein